MPDVILGPTDVLNLRLIFKFVDDLAEAQIVKETQIGEIRLESRFAFLQLGGVMATDIPSNVPSGISLQGASIRRGHPILEYRVDGLERCVSEEMEAP